MEIDEPIQQLLKSTGWSCEDLLSKLQQYKSIKDTSKKDLCSTPETRSENNDTLDEECVVDSTEEIKESYSRKVQDLELESHLNKLNEKRTEEEDNVVTNSLSITEDFSDTDEEEVEVNATNCSIINEIIDDISSTENSEETKETTVKNKASCQSQVNKDETSEVTEVRVIEVNTDEDDDDEDDSFEEEDSHKVSERTEKFKYLETFPRKILAQPQRSIVDDIVTIPDDEDCEINENKEENPLILGEKIHDSKNSIKHIETSGSSDKIVNEEEDIANAQPPLSENSVLDKKSSENLEDIRNNLKLQLSCLRTRKKGHFLTDLREKVVSEQPENVTDADKVNTDYNDTTLPAIECNSVEKIDEQNYSKINTDSENASCIENDTSNDLYTQTNEFGLVILNVQGGIDIDNIENSFSSKASVPEDNLNEDSSNAMDSVLDNTTDFNDSNSFPSENNTLTDKEDVDPKGVFDEIRKIIWKQRNPLNKTKKYGFDKPIENVDQSELKALSRKEKNRNRESANFSTENSLSSFTTDDTNQTDKNSPFVSNTLDEFLTENSKLNISYKVPKSGAEEGLTDCSYRDESPLVLKKVVEVDQSPKLKKVQTIKAKTVAQRRKILEKQRLKELKNTRLKPEKKNDQNKIATDKSNNKENPIKNEEKMEPVEIKESFIMVNNKKIWVKSTLSDTCLAKITSKNVSPKKTETSNAAKEKENIIKNNQRQKKLSLLYDLGKKYKQQIKYRPGPLSKKPNLQVGGQDNWKTQMKILPKIFVDITPKIGEPISLNILSRLPQSDGILTESQIEFALSVLKTKETKDQHKRFRFPLSYSNKQEHIIVRKQKICTEASPFKKLHSDVKSVDNIVANVIDDLIKYVEIKEIAPTLIKDDDIDYNKVDDVISSNYQEKMPTISENVSSIFKKPQKRRSRIQLELSRLSCKVVNVEVEESLTEELCTKAHCQLGCVCKSLKCDRNSSYHCQKLGCMLECTCPKVERSIIYDNITLPAGTDILSTDTVNRIEDEAKKDLAKVEREFTQTVIHTNDKTIVVGLGGRNKTRRATKAPKKYSDYVDGFYEPVKADQKVKTTENEDFLKTCFVSLEKLHLPGIIPLCWMHNSYDCHCKGKSLSPNDPIKRKSIVEDTSSDLKPIAEEKVVEIPEKKKPFIAKKCRTKKITPSDEHEKVPDKLDISSLSTDNDATRELFTSSGRPIRTIKKPKFMEELESSPSTDNDAAGELFPSSSRPGRTIKKPKFIEELVSSPSTDNDATAELFTSSGRPIRTIKKPKFIEGFTYLGELSCNAECARVRGCPSFILRKNIARSSKNKTSLQKDDFINNITDADILKANIPDSRQVLEVDLLKTQLIIEAKQKLLTCSRIIESSYSGKNKHKRKQTLNVRDDDNITKSNLHQNLAIQRRKKTGLLTRKNTLIEPVFDGEIIIDERNLELLKKMGPRTVSEGYARLLPWRALTESFRSGAIKIWCMIDQPSRLLINKSDKFPPKNYINITQTNQTSEVILWILKNKLPIEYHEDNVSFILKQTKDNYEICGLCTKNFTEDGNLNRPLTEIDDSMKQTEDNLIPFKHRDFNSEPQMLYIKKSRFKLQELVEENLAGVGETSVCNNKLYMWAALPEIYRVCKWRMLYLNSDFTYLYFTTVKYSIKYTDLVAVDNMAKSANCTLVLRNPLIQQAYDHSAFGIYFDAHYQDRLFIGPYFKQFNGDDIETLRYINKSLVCTESFNKMQGKMDYKCGHWLIERPYGSTRRRPGIEPPPMDPIEPSTIDLTNDDEATTDGKRKSDFESDRDCKRPKYGGGKDHIVIVHNNVRIKVIDGVPRKPQDFNRFIITNIPHFGYLGAYQHSTSNEIDVSWPFENKLLRFPTVGTATDFLQERFTSLLQPIPETFRINVIVLTSIDLENSHPINANILTGHYICGDFGCYNVKTTTHEFCLDKLGMTRDELLKVFARRAQAFVKMKIEELAGLLCISKSDLGRYDMVNILDLAKKEIHVQTDLERFHMSKKNDLLLRKRELALKVFTMISRLPDDQKQIENLKFREIFRKYSFTPRKTITEPIEIPDSDEEESRSNADKYKLVGFNQSVLLPETSKIRSEVPMVSLLKDKSIPSKVVETTSAFPQQRKLKLKSVLKPIVPTTSRLSKMEACATASKERISTTTKTNATQMPNKITSPPQFLKGVKIIKTSTGKLVLVSDKDSTCQRKLNSAIGTKVVIKDNKILSIRSMEAKKELGGRPVSILGTSSENEVDCISDKKIDDASGDTGQNKNGNANSNMELQKTGIPIIDVGVTDSTSNEDKVGSIDDVSKSRDSFDALKKSTPDHESNDTDTVCVENKINNLIDLLGDISDSDNDVSELGDTVDKTINNESDISESIAREPSKHFLPYTEKIDEEIRLNDNSINMEIIHSSTCDTSSIPKNTGQETIGDTIDDDNETGLKSFSESVDTKGNITDSDETVSDISEANNCDDKDICVKSLTGGGEGCEKSDVSSDVTEEK